MDTSHPVVDPGFPIGGHGPHRRGCGLLRWLHFENFVCKNERIGTLRGACAGCAPLDLPMSSQQHCAHFTRWQHHFTVPKTILYDLISLEGAEHCDITWCHVELSTFSWQCSQHCLFYFIWVSFIISLLFLPGQFITKLWRFDWELWKHLWYLQ